MKSIGKINTILDLTAEVFSEFPKSDMLDFFVKKRKENLPQGHREGWVQCEIIRKLDPVFYVDLKNRKKKVCDFIVDGIGIELKVSTSFSYKKKRELFDAIRRQHKNADCWMLVTKYDDKKKREMYSDLSSQFPHLEPTFRMIPKPDWCAIIVTRR